MFSHRLIDLALAAACLAKIPEDRILNFMPTGGVVE